MGRQNQRHARKRAVEMPGLWKAWKAKSRLPPLSTAPWKSRQERARFPHFHSSGDEGGWKSGKPKAGFPLSHRHESLSPGMKNRVVRAGFALRPAAGASRRPKSQKVIVVDREK
jgi:hypothetical protein